MMTENQSIFFMGLVTAYLAIVFLILGCKHIEPDNVVLGKITTHPLFLMFGIILGDVIYNLVTM